VLGSIVSETIETIDLCYREHRTIGRPRTIAHMNNSHCLTIGWVGTHNNSQSGVVVGHNKDVRLNL